MRESNKNFNPRKNIIWIVNSIYILGVLASIFFVIHYFLLYLQMREFWWIAHTVFFAVIAILFTFGLTLKKEYKLAIAKGLLAIVILAYAVELHLQYKYFKVSVSKQYEMVASLRRDGHDAQRDIGGRRFIDSNGLETQSGRIFPLGGIANKKTVMEYKGFAVDHPVIETDEYGFNNKKGLYNENDVDIVLIGGCTLEYVGENNPFEENIGERLRNLNYKAINLSKQGANIDDMYLPILKEYAEPLKPKVVIFGFAGALDNSHPPESPILRKYVHEENFTQNLMERQTEIDNLLKDFLYQNWEKKELAKIEKQRYKNIFLRFLSHLTPSSARLPYLRHKLIPNIEIEKVDRVKLPGYSGLPSPYFITIVEKMNKRVSSWGGKLYGMYWPAIARYRQLGFEHTKPDFVKPEEFYGNIEEAFAMRGIGLINTMEDVFDVHPDPLSLFPQRVDPHPNTEAKRLVANAIAKRLQADGFFPRNP